MIFINLNGKKAVLLFESGTNKPFLRFYESNGDFIDADIKHNDLEFKIIGNDTYLYQDSNNDYYVDHSPETLGHK